MKAQDAGDDIREQVRLRYAQAITVRSGCCGSTGCCGGTDAATSVITGNLYDLKEMDGLPEELIAASFGCGNPTALGSLYFGETVLDLGSGAGLDVLLSAKRVGPFGRAYGLDMTDEMLAEANANKDRSGLANVEFLKGHIEDIPLPESTVDVVISNCVINLSVDKDKVFREIYRVLKPGGRVAVSDIVTTRPLPESIRQNLLAWAGCVAGALTQTEYGAKLTQAGFENIEVVITRVYDLASASGQRIVPETTSEERAELNGALVSAFIRAKKPVRSLAAGEDFVIEAAEGDDFPAVCGLLENCGLTTADVGPGQGTYYLAKGKTLLGVAALEHFGKAALLRSFVVAPAARKAGVGRSLLEHVLGESRRAGFSHVYLLTDTAEEYYARYGFSAIDRSQIPVEVLTLSAMGSTCPATCAAMALTL